MTGTLFYWPHGKVALEWDQDLTYIQKCLNDSRVRNWLQVHQSWRTQILRMLTQHNGVMSTPTHRSRCNISNNSNNRQRDGRQKEQEDEKESGGGGEKEELTFTSTFLLSKVLAAAVTHTKKRKWQHVRGGENATTFLLDFSAEKLLIAFLTFWRTDCLFFILQKLLLLMSDVLLLRATAGLTTNKASFFFKAIQTTIYQIKIKNKANQ